jgi:hypothetical protein
MTQHLQICNLEGSMRNQDGGWSKATVGSTKEFEVLKLSHSKCCVVREKLQQIINSFFVEFPRKQVTWSCDTIP